jgi:hypothetical protein
MGKAGGGKKGRGKENAYRHRTYSLLIVAGNAPRENWKTALVRLECLHPSMKRKVNARSFDMCDADKPSGRVIARFPNVVDEW